MLKADQPFSSIADLQEAINSGKTTVRAVTGQYLKAIEDLNSELNAFTFINPKALEEADELDRSDPSQRGPLFGVLMVLKDQIETAGMPTAFGSKICRNYIPERDATIVRKLKEARAIVLGKSTMPDWATSCFSTSSLSGTTRNPYDVSRDPGGSSSGSAAAVAAGMAMAAIGGDTGGSIRLPASFCGLVGVRVTPGRISRDGMSPLVVLMDSPGPMTTTVKDAARILDAIVGFDEADDYTSVNVLAPKAGSTTPFQDATKDPSLQGKRLGVLRQDFGSHKGILGVLDSCLGDLEKGGAELIDVDMPDLDHAKGFVSPYATRSKSDINRFLASRGKLAHLKIEDLQAEGTFHEALNLINVIAKGPTDVVKNPHFAQALLDQLQFQRTVASVYAKHKLDAIIYPTSQLLPPKTQDVLDMRCTCLNFPQNATLSSQTDFPAISVPVGMSYDVEDDPEGPALPVGLEILGLALGEEDLLAIAAGVGAACLRRRTR